MTTTGIVASFPDVRLQLADARITLRAAQDAYHAAKLRAEFELIEKAGGDPKALGPNEEMRKRSFDAAVQADEACQLAQDDLREAQARVERLEAALDILKEQRNERDMDLRERNIVVLESWQEKSASVVPS